MEPILFNPPPWVDWFATVTVFAAGILFVAMAFLRIEVPKGPLLLLRLLSGAGFLTIGAGWLSKLLENGELLTLATTEFGVLAAAAGGFAINVYRTARGLRA